MLDSPGIEVNKLSGSPTRSAILHWASKRNDSDTVSQVIERGADPNVRTADGDTALHYACRVGCYIIAKKLVQHGTSLLIQNKAGDTALHAAGRNYNGRPLVDLLTAHDSRIIDVQNHQGETALHLFVLRDDQRAVKGLLQQRASLDIADNEGNTPLHSICFYRFRMCLVSVATILLEAGASVHATNKRGETPLHCAVSKDRPKIVEMLLRNGSDVDAVPTRKGLTLLQIAIANGNSPIIHMLLDHHAAWFNHYSDVPATICPSTTKFTQHSKEH